MKIFKNGLLTGLLLQLAIGPVFFLIVNITLQRTLLDGLMAVLAVTIVDYFYITLALIGVGKLLQKKKFKKIFGIISSVVLIVFGGIIIKGIIGGNISADVGTITSNLVTSFSSVFFLTISSPMGIVFFTSLFAAKAVEYNYKKQELLIFGFATGLATILFMGSSVILFTLIGAAIPVIVIKLLNLLVGTLLIGYGIVRLTKILNFAR